MKGVLAFAAFAFLLSPPLQEDGAPSEPPKITIEKTGDFHELVGELAKQLGIRIQIQEALPKKEIKAAIRDAGLFEALDALCRAHGNVTYFRSGGDHHDREDSSLYLEPGEWKEYPVHYSGHYKTIVSYMMRIRHLSDRGEEGRVQLELSTFAPPWHELGFPGGFDRWTTSEAVTPDGKRVLGPRAMGDLLTLKPSSDLSGNISTQELVLADFDPAKGLAVLAGKSMGKAAANKVFRIPLEAGKFVEFPGGSLTVDAMSRVDNSDMPEHRWRVAFTLKPSGGGRMTPSDRVRFDGEESWGYGIYSGSGPSYEIDSPHLGKAPAWMEFRVKTGERKVEVPYRFTDLKWKDE